MHKRYCHPFCINHVHPTGSTLMILISWWETGGPGKSMTFIYAMQWMELEETCIQPGLHHSIE
jgi:hypothetical protein